MRDYRTQISTKRGMPPVSTIQLPLKNISTLLYHKIAIVALLELDWNILQVDTNYIQAETGSSFTSWGEIFTIEIFENDVLIKCKPTESKLSGSGKNEERILAFLDKIKTELNEEEIKEIEVRYQHFIQQNAVEESNASHKFSFEEKDRKKNVFETFIPTKNYFITPILININILIFILMLANGVHPITPESGDLILWGANFKPLTLQNEWWRLFTCCFLHIGIFHLLVNMYSLRFIGMLIEPVIGKTRFLVAYLLTGLAGSIVSLWWNDLTISAGASGAIFGMFGFFTTILFTDILEKKVKKHLQKSFLLMIGFNLIYGLRAGIDNAGHLGGLVSGLLIGLGFYFSIVKPENMKLKSTTIALMTVIIFVFSSFIYKNIPNSVGQYTTLMEQFSQNEIKALQLFQRNDLSESEIELEIKNNSNNYWKENLEIINEVEKLPALPDQFKDRAQLLKDYCFLRIDINTLYLDAIEQNSTKNDSLIAIKNERIINIINKLKDQNQPSSE